MGVFFDGDEMVGSGPKSSVSYPSSAQPRLFRDWATYPTLNPSSGPTAGPAIEFTRGSTATFTGSNGLIQSAAANTPRFDYDPVTLACKGLLIEEARTNLLTFSEQLDNAAWRPDAIAPCVITANQAVAPDGTTSAALMQEDTARTGTFVFLRTAGITITASSTQVYSVYAKAGTISQIQLNLTTSSNGGQAYFDLTAGTITNSGAIGAGQFIGAEITNVGNGWYRCSLATVVGTATTINPRIALAKSSNSSYTGTGTGNVYLWGAQLEAGAFATSYIPTAAASVTRSADVAQITGSNFTSLWNASAGSAYSQFISRGFMSLQAIAYNGRAIGYDNNSQIIGSGGGTLNKNRLATYNAAGSPTALSTLITGADFTKSPVKGAMSYASTGRSLVGNGQAVVTDAGTIGTITRFVFGNDAQFTSSLNGWLSSIAYYPTRLTDAQLQALTA